MSVSSSEGSHPLCSPTLTLAALLLFLSKRCLTAAVPIFPDCWEGVCWDQSTDWSTWCIRGDIQGVRGRPGSGHLGIALGSRVFSKRVELTDSTQVRGLGAPQWVSAVGQLRDSAYAAWGIMKGMSEQQRSFRVDSPRTAEMFWGCLWVPVFAAWANLSWSGCTQCCFRGGEGVV